MLDLRHPLIVAALAMARAINRLGASIPKGFAGVDKLFEACAAFEAEYQAELDRQAFGDEGR